MTFSSQASPPAAHENITPPLVWDSPAAIVVMPAIGMLASSRYIASGTVTATGVGSGSGSGIIVVSSVVGVSLPPSWTQPYMTAVRATIEHAASKLRVSFVFFMASRLSSF